MSVADDLKATRDLLIERGRAIGTGQDKDGRVCLGHAVGMASRDIATVRPVFEALAAHIPQRPREDSLLREVRGASRIADFNDASTDEEVFALIDKALADLGALG